MKIIDNILMIAAGYCLFVMTIVVSTDLFSGVNELIPELFSGRAMITISEIFHLVIASLVTGLFYVRFAPSPILIALAVAILLKADTYLLFFSSDLYTNSISYYSANPEHTLPLLKPIFILPSITYLIGLIRFTKSGTSSETN